MTTLTVDLVRERKGRVANQRTFPLLYTTCPDCLGDPGLRCGLCLDTRRVSKGTARALAEGRDIRESSPL